MNTPIPNLTAVALCLLTVAVAASAPSARAAGDPQTAALQVALRARGFYAGPVDGITGAATTAAVRALQSTHGLVADGVVGPGTRRLLGPFARRELGSRALARGDVGWDVAELQFALAWRGFPSSTLDGHFGAHLESALRHFQRSVGQPVDGVAGPGTITALRHPAALPQLALAWPVVGIVGDPFGPRDNRFHAGVDLVANAGTPVTAAAAGRVTWVGERGGWGLLVTVAHPGGVRTMYAHLSRATVRLGQRVSSGEAVGLVGSSGDATGPHLHFEVRVGSAAVDPLAYLH